jgi:hypothetical protein
MKRFFITIFCILLLFSEITKGQSRTDEKELLQTILQFTSQIYGSDEALINGFAYTPHNVNASGDPFFKSASYANASISISDKVFNVESLKFDIAEERLILLVTVKSGAKFPILLNNEFIQYFELYQANFFPATKYFSDNEVKGFVDVVYSGSFFFVTKYKKEFVKMYTKVDPFGKYSETQIHHYLIRDGVSRKIKNKKNLLDAFKPFQKDISKYMKTNHIKFKKANHQQLVQLLSYCDELAK